MEYISREGTMEKVRRMPRTVNPDLVQYSLVKGIIAGMPAADVAPVRHGRWIEDERTYPGPGLKNNLCSACGEVAGAWKEGLEPGRKWAYCPNCGALMDGKEDEHEAG